MARLAARTEGFLQSKLEAEVCWRGLPAATPLQDEKGRPPTPVLLDW